MVSVGFMTGDRAEMGDSSGGLKFPLGSWKEGETRKFIYQVWQSKESERVESITIQK
jgi:hypothetical protein